MQRWLTFFRRRRQARRLQFYRTRREAIMKTLLSPPVLPPGIPYLLEAAPSFLQRGEYGAAPKVAVDLFLHTAPLAVLILSPADRRRYRDAQWFVDEAPWRARQAELTHIRQRLLAQGCPLLELADDDPLDPASLKERLQLLLGASS